MTKKPKPKFSVGDKVHRSIIFAVAEQSEGYWYQLGNTLWYSENELMRRERGKRKGE